MRLIGLLFLFSPGSEVFFCITMYFNNKSNGNDNSFQYSPLFLWSTHGNYCNWWVISPVLVLLRPNKYCGPRSITPATSQIAKSLQNLSRLWTVCTRKKEPCTWMREPTIRKCRCCCTRKWKRTWLKILTNSWNFKSLHAMPCASCLRTGSNFLSEEDLSMFNASESWFTMPSTTHQLPPFKLFVNDTRIEEGHVI